MTQKYDITLRREKIEAITQEIIEQNINTSNLSIHEMIHVMGNLLFSIGGSINGYTSETSPSLEKIQETYTSDPSNLGNSLMFNGLLIQTWTQDLTLEDK